MQTLCTHLQGSQGLVRDEVLEAFEGGMPSLAACLGCCAVETSVGSLNLAQFDPPHPGQFTLDEHTKRYGLANHLVQDALLVPGKAPETFYHDPVTGVANKVDQLWFVRQLPSGQRIMYEPDIRGWWKDYKIDLEKIPGVLFGLQPPLALPRRWDESDGYWMAAHRMLRDSRLIFRALAVILAW